MNKIKILGWILLPLNIIGLCFSVYTLQGKFHIAHLFGAVLFVAQIIYIVKTLKVWERIEFSKKKLESAARESGLTMTKILKGEEEKRKGKK